MSAENKGSKRKTWIRLGVKLLAIIAMVFLIRSFAFTSCLIPYSGMENSLFQGERILVNKWSYGLRVPFMSLFSYHRWLERPVGKQEIVVFNNPAAGTKLAIDRRAVYISRCIGTPGDTLLIDSCFSVVSPEAEVNPDKNSCMPIRLPKKRYRVAAPFALHRQRRCDGQKRQYARTQLQPIRVLPVGTSDETQSVDISVARRRCRSAEAAHHSG